MKISDSIDRISSVVKYLAFGGWVMSDDVSESVVSIIATSRGIPVERLNPDSNFKELGFDSLDMTEIMFELESAFDISISDEQALGIKTVRDAVEGVKVLISTRSSSVSAAQ
jgi:acyl carrier protein